MARVAVDKAIGLDADDAICQAALFEVNYALGDIIGFERAADRMLELNPNYSDGLAKLAFFKACHGDLEGGLAFAERALSLCSNPPSFYHLSRGLILYQLRD